MKVINNEIIITPTEWVDLNKTLSQEEIKELISNTIDEYQIPMPLRDISFDDAITDYNNLKLLNTQDLIIESEWYTRYAYRDEYFKLNKVIKSNSIGSKASDYFMQEERWKCDSINAPSPYRSWYIKKFRMSMLNALWSLRHTEVNNKTLRTCIALRKYIASQFRPSAVKYIYNEFNGKNILDFSSGWGDRLLGFLSSNAKSYTGIDPNKNLFPIYKEIIDTFNTEGKYVEMFNSPAEDVVLYNKYDLIFTSPPYFNIERYTQEDNQSFKKYRKLNVWLEKFLFKSIETFWNDNLIKNGYLIINISDVYSNHTINQICDPMNDFISTLAGAEYQGAIGYQLRKRPNSKSIIDKNGIFAEPIWIWKKNV